MECSIADWLNVHVKTKPVWYNIMTQSLRLLDLQEETQYVWTSVLTSRNEGNKKYLFDRVHRILT